MSGGAGIGGAGGVGAGLSSSSAAPAPRAVRPPWALKLDPITRDFVLDADGRYVEAHPVDHEAMMRLLPQQGGMPVAPGQGIPWQSLRIEEPAQMARRIREYVEAAWRPLLARGDVRILSISLRPTNSHGRARFYLEWMNLRDPSDPTRKTEV